MKKDNRFLVYIIFLLFGALLSYWLCQYSFFKINREINITETLISLATVIVGLYIAITIQKTQNRSQNLHGYLVNRLEKAWNEFTKLDQILQYSNTIELTEIAKQVKSIYMNIEPLKVIFRTFNISSDCLDCLEKEIDKLENLFQRSGMIKDNIVSTKSILQQMNQLITSVNAKFASVLSYINHHT